MELKLEDYITLPAVNVSDMEYEDKVTYVTDTAARTWFEENPPEPPVPPVPPTPKYRMYYTTNDDQPIDTDFTRTATNVWDPEAESYVLEWDEPLTVIPQNAFAGCSSLTSVIIPDTVTAIKCYAFVGCNSMDSITVPSNVTELEYLSLTLRDENHKIEPYNVIFESEVPNISLVDDGGSIIDPFSDDGTCFPMLATIYVPSGCKSAYVSHDDGWAALEPYISEDTPTPPVPPVPPVPPTPSIPHDEIWYTSTDGEIVVPYTPSPGSGSGSGSGNGTSSEHTGDVGESESPLPEILSNTYVDGKGVIKFAEDVETIGIQAFNECSNLLSIALPDSVISIGNRAFSGCDNLTEITLPNSVESIGFGAFGGTGIIELTIPNSVTELDSSCFAGMISLTTITIGNGVTSIPTSAFQGCSSLTTINIGSGVTSIGSGTFQGCSSLQTLVIPDNVKSIGGDSFWGCNNLTSVTLPSGLKSIQGGMFYGCSKLASIDIPESVTLIGDRTFRDCTGMTTITCRPTSVPAMGSNVWINVPTNIPVYVPAQSITSYQSNSAWHNFTNIQAIQ